MKMHSVKLMAVRTEMPPVALAGRLTALRFISRLVVHSASLAKTELYHFALARKIGRKWLGTKRVN